MKNFNHPHVLSLLGLCLGYKKEPMVILPFMANGDLRSYVKDKTRVSMYMVLLQRVSIALAMQSAVLAMIDSV